MGGGMKTSDLLGYHFLLVCKHCKQVFDNFKHLKSHLRKIHQVQTSSNSNSTASSGNTIKMNGSQNSSDVMASQKSRDVSTTSQMSCDVSLTPQRSRDRRDVSRPPKSPAVTHTSLKSRDVSVSSKNGNSSMSVDAAADAFPEEDYDVEEIRPPPIPECISPPDKIPKGYKLCTECPRVIRYPAKGPKTEYNAHLEIHSGIRTFVCPYCLLGFVDPVSLLSHTTQNHTGILAFECETCAKTFKTMKGLQIHQRLKKECKIRDAIRI